MRSGRPVPRRVIRRAARSPRRGPRSPSGTSTEVVMEWVQKAVEERQLVEKVPNFPNLKLLSQKIPCPFRGSLDRPWKKASASSGGSGVSRRALSWKRFKRTLHTATATATHPPAVPWSWNIHWMGRGKHQADM